MNYLFVALSAFIITLGIGVLGFISIPTALCVIYDIPSGTTPFLEVFTILMIPVWLVSIFLSLENIARATIAILEER